MITVDKKLSRRTCLSLLAEGSSNSYKLCTFNRVKNGPAALDLARLTPIIFGNRRMPWNIELGIWDLVDDDHINARRIQSGDHFLHS